MSTVHFLDNHELVRFAPCVAAAHGSTDVSAKYVHFNTLNVVDALRSAGWFPIKAVQSFVRLPQRQGFQKHAIRFRRDSKLFDVGDYVPELLLINASDGRSSYQLHAALTKVICKNQLTVSDSLFDSIRLRHLGFNQAQVIEASYRVLNDLPKIAGSIEEMKSIIMTANERRGFAEAALAIKYTEHPAPITAESLLRIRRIEDRSHDLFSTLNVVQENIIVGGIRGRVLGADGRIRATRSRGVKSVQEDIRINKALWALAEDVRASRHAKPALSLLNAA